MVIGRSLIAQGKTDTNARIFVIATVLHREREGVSDGGTNDDRGVFFESVSIPPCARCRCDADRA
jgi:hypothetical protein